MARPTNWVVCSPVTRGISTFDGHGEEDCQNFAQDDEKSNNLMCIVFFVLLPSPKPPPFPLIEEGGMWAINVFLWSSISLWQSLFLSLLRSVGILNTLFYVRVERDGQIHNCKSMKLHWFQWNCTDWHQQKIWLCVSWPNMVMKVPMTLMCKSRCQLLFGTGTVLFSICLGSHCVRRCTIWLPSKDYHNINVQ